MKLKPKEQGNVKSKINTILHPGLLIIQSALMLMLGITIALQFPHVSLWFPLSGVILFGLAAILFRTKKHCHILILLFICCSGTTLGIQKLAIPARPHIRGFVDHAMTLTCSGVIKESLASNSERVKIILDLDTIYTPVSLATTSEQIQHNLFTTKTYGLIQLSMPSFPHDLSPGDQITVQVKLSPPRGFVNPGGFNLPFFLQSQNIFVSGWVSRPDTIVKHDRTPDSLWNLTLQAEKIRSQLINFYNSTLNPTHGSLYRSLITGDRSSLAIETQEMFKNLGIFHLLAISGLHMGLLAGFIMWLSIRVMRLFPQLLLYIPARQGGAALAMLPVIFYCFISGLHPPAVRACLMTVILFSAFIFRKQWHGPSALATAALLILLHNPLLLGMVSFQLSFIAVTAIIFILPGLKNHLFTATTKPSIFTTARNTILSGLAISLVASIATLPLLLFHFNRISLVSPFTTLIMEPLLCLWALGFGLTGSFVSFFYPTFAEYLLHIGTLGFDCSLWLGNIINQIPNLNLWLPTPPLWQIILFYSTFTIFFLLQNKRSFLLFIFSFIILLLPQSRNLTHDRVTIIDVGKGNSSLIECTTGETILIDCGGPSGGSFNVGRQVIAPFLYQQQIRSLDLVVLSHADLDHYSGATFIMNHFQPKELWLPYKQADNSEWDLMIETANKQGVILRIPQVNESFPLKNNRSLTTISDTHLTRENWSQNEQSLVIRFKSGPYSFLFPGDIEEKSENRLIQQNTSLEATVLVAPHHGSKSSSTPSFIQQVKPKYTVFSSSLYGQTVFPAPLIVERYKKIGSIPLKTAQKGAITFILNPDELDVATCIP